MEKKKVGIFVGSFRRGSFSKSVADALAGYLKDEHDVHFIDFSDLPMFNQDYDDDGATPLQWTRFREEVGTLDAFLFVTPEYNRSFPPVLKNALDIASRPYGQSKWGGKPGAIVSVSPGRPGAFGANHHLRQVASFLDIYMMQQPEAYIGSIADSLGGNAEVSNDATLGFLKTVAEAFSAWIRRF